MSIIHMGSCSGDLFWYLQEERPEKSRDIWSWFQETDAWLLALNKRMQNASSILHSPSQDVKEEEHRLLLRPQRLAFCFLFGSIKWPLHLFCSVLHSCICYTLESKWLSHTLILSLPDLRENQDDPKALRLIYSIWFLSIIIHWLSRNEKYISIKMKGRTFSFWDLPKLASMRICFGSVEVH